MTPYLHAYVGQTRFAPYFTLLEQAGVREMVVRGELPNRRHPWAFDNGAYRDWKAGRPFDFDRFAQDLDWIQLHARTRPDFIVAPDIVAGGLESLRVSTAWLPKIAGRRIGPVYLAVQDGMGETDVATAIAGFGGVFVGGSTEWKLNTGHRWASFAHERGIACHIARVSSMKRIRWAFAARADSIDSCQPLRSRPQLLRFLRALREPELDLGAA